MNSVNMIGRLARDPELRFTASGKAVASFSIAINNIYNKDRADFFNVVVWGKIAENCANYLAKGRLVGIEGRLQARSYETQSGDKRYITEVVANQVEFLEWGSKKENNKESKSEKNTPEEMALEDFQAVDDDGVPF